jgi:hypothetical protein
VHLRRLANAFASLIRAIRRARNRGSRSTVTRGVELLLIVLLVLMIPGLVTYLRPTRDTSAERADS